MICISFLLYDLYYFLIIYLIYIIYCISPFNYIFNLKILIIIYFINNNRNLEKKLLDLKWILLKILIGYFQHILYMKF